MFFSTNDATLSVDDSVDALKAELKRKEEEVEILQKELLKCKRQCEKTATYNDDLRKQVEKLSDLLNQRCVKNQKSVHIQVNASEIDDGKLHYCPCQPLFSLYLLNIIRLFLKLYLAYANGNWLAASEKANVGILSFIRILEEVLSKNDTS